MKRVHKKETAIFRMDTQVGFNARVEPFGYSIERANKNKGLFDRWRVKTHVNKVIRQIQKGLREQDVDEGDWIQRDGKCLANIRVARIGMSSELREYATMLTDGHPDRQFPHLLKHRDRNSYYIPVSFLEPFMIRVEEDVIPVSSSLNLQIELDELNRDLQVEKTFAMKKMVDFLDMKESEIEKLEAKYTDAEDFWIKFAFLVLRRITDLSVTNTMPVIFA